MEPIPKDLFDILACPLCKSDLRYTKNKKALVCVKCSHKYPIRDGTPSLLPY
ncbi:Trm112 family protein [Candidatus Woesearchaeota archaeon]|nr:Trm112 family protein [Candidatus Woesearchaeota archaeon]